MSVVFEGRGIRLAGSCASQNLTLQTMSSQGSIASYNVVFTFQFHHTTFEVVIDKTKLHIESQGMRNNSF